MYKCIKGKVERFMRKQLCAALAVILISSNAVLAAPNYNFTQTQQPAYQPNYYKPAYTSSNGTLKGSVVTVPAGQAVPAVVTAPINSATAVLGQTVNLALSSDFYYNGSLIAPAGSSVVGTVLEVSKAKHGSMNGKLLLRFNQIVTPYGVQIPISAVVKTEDNTGVLVGGTKMDVAKDYGKDLAGGSVGKGAALGTAVGAGGGLVKSLWDKGDDVEIPVNASIQLILTQPITVNPAIYN